MPDLYGISSNSPERAKENFFVTYLCNYYLLPVRLLKKYRKYWNWFLLGWNENLPWSEELLIAFEQDWVWETYNEGAKYPDMILEQNPGFPWTPRILEHFRDKIDWEGVSQNKELLKEYPEILKRYEALLNWNYITGDDEPWLNLNHQGVIIKEPLREGSLPLYGAGYDL